MSENISLMLPDEYSQVIGNIAIYWSGLELSIEMLLVVLMDAGDKYGGAVTSNLNPRTRNDLANLILKDKYGENSEQYKTLSPLINKANDLLTKRNHIVHGLWTYDLEKKHGERHVFKRNSLESSPEKIKLSDLKGTLKSIIQTDKKLNKEITRYGLGRD